MAQQQIRKYYKTPEGRYSLVSERLIGLVSFNPHRNTKITIADLKGDKADEVHTYVVFNVGENLHICPYDGTDREPFRTICFAPPTGQILTFPTCHDFAPSSDDYDLLIGLYTGDVLVVSLKLQIMGSGTNNRIVSALCYNPDGALDPSKCTSIAWVPGVDAKMFLTAHTSGFMYLFQKDLTYLGDNSKYSGKNSLAPTPIRIFNIGCGGINSIAPSPDGLQIAVATREGYMELFEIGNGRLLAGFKSYYGGLLCVTWSPDGRYIATGGEDDLVAVFGVHEKCVVAYGEGHNSWVSAVAFDPWNCNIPEQRSPGSPTNYVDSETVYRLASTGQDCQMCMWSVVISEETLSNIPALNGRHAGGTPRSDPAGSPFQRAGDMDRASLPGTPASGSQTSNSLNGISRAVDASAIIQPSPSRSEMPIIPPLMQHRMHFEPLSDIKFRRDSTFTACASGQIKRWRRPDHAQDHMSRTDSLTAMDDSD